MSMPELHNRVRELMRERAVAERAGLTELPIYMSDLEEEIVSALSQIAVLRAATTGPLAG
jgi:hypothetical protein